MLEPDPVDLSPLRPDRDPERWARLVGATRARVSAVLANRVRSAHPLDLMSAWARPILAAAAALIILFGGVLALLPGTHPSSPASDARRLARITETAMLHGRLPLGTDLVTVVRGTVR